MSGSENSAREERLRDAAKRALEEAKARKRSAMSSDAPAEIDGPQGPEPTRYGDWERGGIARDF